MLLAADVGNTNTKLTIIDGYNTVATLTLSNAENPKAKTGFLSKKFQNHTKEVSLHYSQNLSNFLESHGAKGKIDGAIISSVVPSITAPLYDAIEQTTGCKPLAFTDAGFSYGMSNLVSEERKKTIGQDLVAIGYGAYIIANAIAEDNYSLDANKNIKIDMSKYQEVNSGSRSPTIVICSGTATTTNLVTKEGELIVASIATGITKSTNALFAGTALIKNFDLNQTAPAVNETFGCVANGQAVIQALGHKAFAEKMNREYLADDKTTIKIITGGAAPLLGKYINDDAQTAGKISPDRWYEVANLIPIGLAGLYYLNKASQSPALEEKKGAEISSPRL